MSSTFQRWLVYSRIYIPMAQQALVAIFVIGFINNWGELLRPLVFLNSSNLFTVPLGLLSFYSQYDAAWHQLMAGSVISVLPMVLIYVISQKNVFVSALLKADSTSRALLVSPVSNWCFVLIPDFAVVIVVLAANLGSDPEKKYSAT